GRAGHGPVRRSLRVRLDDACRAIRYLAPPGHLIGRLGKDRQAVARRHEGAHTVDDPRGPRHGIRRAGRPGRPLAPMRRALVVLLMVTAGCAARPNVVTKPVDEMVVLLPASDGKVGALTVTHAGHERSLVAP